MRDNVATQEYIWLYTYGAEWACPNIPDPQKKHFIVWPRETPLVWGRPIFQRYVLRQRVDLHDDPVDYRFFDAKWCKMHIAAYCKTLYHVFICFHTMNRSHKNIMSICQNIQTHRGKKNVPACLGCSTVIISHLQCFNFGTMENIWTELMHSSKHSFLSEKSFQYRNNTSMYTYIYIYTYNI